MAAIACQGSPSGPFCWGAGVGLGAAMGTGVGEGVGAGVGVGWGRFCSISAWVSGPTVDRHSPNLRQS